MWGGWLVMDDRKASYARQRRDMAVTERWIRDAPYPIRRTHLRSVNGPHVDSDRPVPVGREGRAPGAGVGRWAYWFGLVGWGAGTVILAADQLARWL